MELRRRPGALYVTLQRLEGGVRWAGGGGSEVAAVAQGDRLADGLGCLAVVVNPLKTKGRKWSGISVCVGEG